MSGLVALSHHLQKVGSFSFLSENIARGVCVCVEFIKFLVRDTEPDGKNMLWKKKLG